MKTKQHTVLGEERDSSTALWLWTFYLQGLPTAASKKHTLPPPPYKHGHGVPGKKVDAFPLCLGRAQAEGAPGLSSESIRLSGSGDGGTAEEGAVEAGVTLCSCHFCFPERWPVMRYATWWGWGPAAGCSASCRARWAWTKSCCGPWSRVPSAFGNCSTSWASNSSSATGWEKQTRQQSQGDRAGSGAAHPKPRHYACCSSALNADTLRARC